MTDRDLLENAAKATGIEFTIWHDKPAQVINYGNHLRETRFWNPLQSDGDALRLAVKLGIQIDPRSPETRVFGPVGDVVTQYHKPDPYAATRLAIVIAASEIGRNT